VNPEDDAGTTLTDEEIETRPLGGAPQASFDDADTSDTAGDTGDAGDTSDTADDTGDVADTTDTGDDAGDGAPGSGA
jgi:hypothetical protein